MDWSQSYAASWRIFRVNRRTWADAEQVDNIDSVSVTRTADGSLLESASFELTGDFTEDYYRIVMTAEQSGEVTRVDVATLLFNISSGKYDYGVNVQTAEGHSVLYPASTTTIMAGEYAPAGVDGASYAAKLLQDAINAPVEVEGGFTLNDHVVHEIGTSVLDAVWSVLEAGPDGGYIIQIDGRGVVHIRPQPKDPALLIDSTNAALLTNEINFTTDESDVPNRYVVIDGASRTVAENNDPDSPISYINRGYYVDEVDESPTPVNGETLSAYATRKLKEMSVRQDERTYTREYHPDVNLYSIVRASIDGLEGDLKVKSQTLTCNYGITVNEKAVREVSLW